MDGVYTCTFNSDTLQANIFDVCDKRQLLFTSRVVAGAGYFFNQTCLIACLFDDYRMQLSHADSF